MAAPAAQQLDIEVVQTKPFAGQKPGTSGLRKTVKEVQQEHYLANFVQCIFDSLPANELTGSTLVLSGDGRFYNTEAATLILRMAVANGVRKIITGENAIMSTPCVSGVIRSTKSYGGIILTASHNPGGPDADFGIKYNCSNGGPAPESLTDAMFAKSKTITQYKIAKQKPSADILTKIGVQHFGSLEVEVISAPAAYAELMESIFDFAGLRALVARKDFRFVYDAMNGVAGPFAREIFLNKLGASAECVINSVPKEDFGGCHPDPNLTYAEELVKRMGVDATGAPLPGVDPKSLPDFGAAADGDADRNMILGRQFFVTPSDSVAIIAANAQRAIPYFKGGVKGVARSMPTSAALDKVAAKLGLKCYEVPTGWKFFGNLMDAGSLSICGEESFGTGSDHIREKDGVWAVLAWLSILRLHNPDDSKPLVSVQEIVEQHWALYGRNYYCRYDYESVDSAAAATLMAELVKQTAAAKGSKWGSFTVAHADEFTYTDPVDHSVSAHQGIRFLMEDGSRVIFRLSGTGSVGATIRMYIEKYETDGAKLLLPSAQALKPLIEAAVEKCRMKEICGRDKPTVIT